MHELSIATSLVDLASDYARRQGADRVVRLKVRLGVLSGLLRPLYFCFASASRGTFCEGAVLEIEEVPLRVRCERCGETKTPGTRYSFRCPDCGSPTPQVVSGREMQLVTIELNRVKGMPDKPPAAESNGQYSDSSNTHRFGEQT